MVASQFAQVTANDGAGAMVARWAAWALLTVVVVLTFVPPELRPVSGAPQAFEHFVAFLLPGIAFAWGYPQRRVSIVLASLPLLAILEWLQGFAPGRHARLTDFVVNTIAACLGVALVALAARIRSRGSAQLSG